jgi:uncharacterized membrane protein YqjE
MSSPTPKHHIWLQTPNPTAWGSGAAPGPASPDSGPVPDDGPGTEPRVSDVGRPPNEQNDKSLADLLNDFGKEMTTLLHQELELAKAELTAKGKRLGTGAGLLGAAAIAAFLALAALTTCAIVALSAAVPLWLAALIVALLLLGVASLLGLRGRADIQRASPPVPEQAVESTKENMAWLKQEVRSAKP